jgi:hypothetical protein
MSDEPVPDLFGHCAPLKPVRRRRAVVPVALAARPLLVGEEAGPAPVPDTAPTTVMVMPPPPPPPPVVIIERIPAPPFGLDDARTFMEEAEDEGLADLAREAVRLLRRRLDRAVDDGGTPPMVLVRAVQAIAAELSSDGEPMGDGMGEVVQLSGRRGSGARRR